MKARYFIALFLTGVAFGQATESGKSLTTGAELWEYFAGVVSIMDVAIPTFPDGPLLLPTGIDPLTYTESGPPTHTVYLDDNSNSCPKSPAGCGIYSGHVNSSGVCSGCTLITPFTGHADFTDLNTITSNWDGTYWDSWVTHGAHFDSTLPWIWPDKFGATAFLDFHSDCVGLSQAWVLGSAPLPCSGTNDLGYNPRGRQVTTHGSLDIGLNPPVPNMGMRNRFGDGSVLGFPSPASPVPATSAAYPVTNCTVGASLPCSPSSNPYNDLANMWTISSSNNGVVSGGGSVGSVIQMGPAHTDGTTNCYGGPCPNDGVNHINIHDAHIFPDPAGHIILPVDITAQEWTTNPNNNPLINAYVNAAPHDIFFSEDLFTSDGDEDGFNVNSIASGVRFGGVRIGINHSAEYGVTHNATECHGISFGPPGPMQFVDNWWEGCSIPVWGGGGGTPAVCADNSGGGLQCDNGMLTGNVERARSHVAYNPRWLPSSSGSGNGNGGIQGRNTNIASYACSSGTLTLTVKNNVGAESGQIFNPIVYVQGLTSVGVQQQWYGASNVVFDTSLGINGIQTGTAIVLPGSACTAGGTGNGNTKIYGFEGTTQGGATLQVTSVAAMNALTCGSSTWGTLQTPCNPISNQNPVFKNLNEWKESYDFWVDGEIWENAGTDAQEGQCSSHSIRACSGTSKCGDGFSQDIHDFLISNTICRHSAQGLLHDGRSQNGSYSCWPTNGKICPSATTLASVSCDDAGAGNGFHNLVDFTFSTSVPPDIINAEYSVAWSKYTAANGYPAASLFTGTDVYIYGTGDSLLPDGWYQTANINYANIIPVFLTSGVCTGHTFTGVGTVVARESGKTDGAGVTPGMHHGVTNNFLLYDQGNHNNWNGSGSAPSINDSPGGQNYGVFAVMGPATGTPCTSAGQAVGTILTGEACIQSTTIAVCPAATYGSIPDCPRVLLAEVGDLMNIVCPTTNAPINCGIFATATAIPASSGGGDPGTRGVKIIDLDPNQRWFTYAPPSYSSGNAGLTSNIPSEPPNGLGIPEDYGSSGLYATQSYPKTMYYNHVTVVGTSGAYVSGGSFQSDLTFKNGFTIVPGTGDTGAPAGSFPCGGSIRCGFAVPGNDTYTGPTAGSCTGGGMNVTGITNMGEPLTLDFQNWGAGARTLTNYPRWISNTPGCSNDGYLVGENTTPPRATAGTGVTSVTCNGGLACDSLVTCLASPTTCHDAPDFPGFIGAMNTTTYPLNLPDFRQYALDPSSPYKQGGPLQSDDLLDNAVIVPYLTNAQARTIRPVLASGYTYYHDGPQYEWLTWTCTGTCASFTVLEDSNPVLTTPNLFGQVYGLGIGSSHSWAVTSAHGGDVVVITNEVMY